MSSTSNRRRDPARIAPIVKTVQFEPSACGRPAVENGEWRVWPGYPPTSEKTSTVSPGPAQTLSGPESSAGRAEVVAQPVLIEREGTARVPTDVTAVRSGAPVLERDAPPLSP